MWRDEDCADVQRGEALWEHWRRVAEGEEVFSEELWYEVLVGLPPRFEDALGVVARNNAAPEAQLNRVWGVLPDVEEPQRSWLRSQIRARNTIEAFRRGDAKPRTSAVDTLLEKGLAWAVLEVEPFLSAEEKDYALRMIESTRCFTRRQRHDVRGAFGER